MDKTKSLGVYYIPRLLDAPPKMFYWEIDEFMAAATPVGIGLIMGWFMVGVALGLLAGYAIGKFKAGRGAHYMLHVLYWYVGMGKLKSTPPSYIREFVG